MWLRSVRWTSPSWSILRSALWPLVIRMEQATPLCGDWALIDAPAKLGAWLLLSARFEHPLTMSGLPSESEALFSTFPTNTDETQQSSLTKNSSLSSEGGLLVVLT